MRHATFGSTGRDVPVIGQGTWCIDDAHQSQAVEALSRGLDLGMVHIDTAEMYGSGAAERIVGKAIRGRRDNVFLVSKVLPENASRKGTRDACERSLRHLGTDRLDCYLLHWRGSHPLEETFAAFEDLLREGKILSYGVSNFDVADLEEAQAITGPGRIACNQVLYHLGERAVEHAVLPWCQDNGVALVAYCPFGRSAFPAPDSPGGQVLAGIAERHGASARQVALAALTHRPAVFAIPKAARVPHVADNAGGGSLALTADDLARIDAAFPRGPSLDMLPTV